MSELQYALDRMSTPLHASRISDATAAEDARCMAIIRAEIDRLTRELDEARAERDAMAKALLECATVEIRLGDKELSDAIDNHGMPYQSQWLADLLTRRVLAKDAEAR